MLFIIARKNIKAVTLENKRILFIIYMSIYSWF